MNVLDIEINLCVKKSIFFLADMIPLNINVEYYFQQSYHLIFTVTHYYTHIYRHMSCWVVSH